MDGPNHRRRPSLHTAITLARLVQHFRNRLKARVKTRVQRIALLQTPTVVDDNELTEFESEARIRTQSTPPKLPRHRNRFSNRIIVYGRKLSISNLLQDLDHHVTPRGTSLSCIAKDDQRLLEYNARDFANSRQIEHASHTLDITTLLIDRLHEMQNDEAAWPQAAVRHHPIDQVDYEKYVANLEHLLRCLQQAALESLIQHSLEALESDYHHWDKYLEQRRGLHDDWFTEWPSGRPPLNSTMPWNIKPSLAVLWGVCWMFYMPNASASGSRPTSEGAWAGAQPWARGGDAQNVQNLQNVQNFGYVEAEMPSEMPVARAAGSSRVGRSLPGLSVAPGISVGPMMASPSPIDHIGHSPYQAEMTGAYMTRVGQGESPNVPLNLLSDYATPLRKTNQQFINTRTPVCTTASSSEASFATSSPIWPNTNNPFRAQSFALGHHPGGLQEPRHRGISSSSSDISYIHPSTIQQDYVEAYRQGGPSTSGPSPHPHPAFPYTTNFGSGLLPTGPFSDMTARRYPTPGSEASERAPLSSITMGDETKPDIAPGTSPSAGRSDDSRRDSNLTNTDPPRNEYNQIYCSHSDCASNPQTFSRKCEWTKHMDKHTRPYVCRAPGCEKLLGFTYSGGLLRHEREVHRRHGGPKAPQFCPHLDCKRSTGPGFSRKENLMEHLRRVHRGAEIGTQGGGLLGSSPTVQQQWQQQQQPQQISATSPAMPGAPATELRTPEQSRKRRRAELGDGDEMEQYGEDTGHGFNLAGTVAELRAENKRQRQELQAKDEIIRAKEERINALSEIIYGGMGQAPHHP